MQKSLAMVLTVGAIALVGAAVWINRSRPQAPLATESTGSESAPAKMETPDSGKPTLVSREDLPFKVEKNGFVSSDACRECHADQHASWHKTFHRTMTQVASPESVLAPFDNVRLSSRGREYYLSREGDKFYVTGADPDFEAAAQANGVDPNRLNPPIVKRQIVMTTGSHHMQGYWVVSQTHKNMLRQMPWTYIISEKRWVPREDNFLVPPDEPRHFAVWNDNCIVCHAVGGNPNFDLQAMKVATEVAELGISCEACHGPGKPHIDFQRKAATNKLIAQVEKDPVIDFDEVSTRIAGEICGQCHAYFSPTDWNEFAKSGYQYRAAGDYEGTRIMTTFEGSKANSATGQSDLYWNDGTCRVGGREFNAMIASACFQRGTMTCIQCHSMHDSDPNDQLADRMDTNDACLQCHQKYGENITAHTHHAADSSGSLCYNCHMPHTTYGALKTMRSHRVQSPKAQSMAVADHPNACNLCHLDKTLDWTAQRLEEWYKSPRTEFAPDEKQVAASLLWLLKGDAAQRAVTAWHMNWQPALEASGNQWQAPFLARTLVDDYSAVRYLAEKALRREPDFKGLKYDYIGKAADRKTASQRMMELWATREKTPTSAPEILLMNPSGQTVDINRMEAILQQQNKRPTSLPE